MTAAEIILSCTSTCATVWCIMSLVIVWSQSQKFYDRRNQLAAQVITLTAGVGGASYTCATGWWGHEAKADVWWDPPGQQNDTAGQVDWTEKIYFLICRQQLSWVYILLIHTHTHLKHASFKQKAICTIKPTALFPWGNTATLDLQYDFHGDTWCVTGTPNRGV